MMMKMMAQFGHFSIKDRFVDEIVWNFQIERWFKKPFQVTSKVKEQVSGCNAESIRPS